MSARLWAWLSSAALKALRKALASIVTGPILLAPHLGKDLGAGSLRFPGLADPLTQRPQLPLAVVPIMRA